jgi:hypothetical protein
MRSSSYASSILVSLSSLWLSGCIDAPFPDIEPQARLIAVWDPVACDEPHRVAIELEDELGILLSTSVPCELGGATIDVRTWGVYRGRIYAWDLGPEIRSVLSVRIEIDAPIIHWYVDTPR